MKPKQFIIAGIISGIAISALEYLIHGVLMTSYYAEYAQKGVMDTVGKPFGFIHYALQMLLGFPIVYLYWLASKSLKRTLGNTALIGLLAGVFCISITSALYTFYNLGAVIPVVITVDKLLECIVCCLIAHFSFMSTSKAPKS